MRITHAIAGPYPAFRGSQVLVAQLVEGLRDRGHTVDVVHAHNYEAGAAACLVSRLTGAPFVFHGHSAMAAEMPLYARGPRSARVLSWVGGVLDATIPQMADACLAVTEELAGTLGRAGARRVVWLPPQLRPTGEGPTAGEGESPVPTVAYAGNLDAYQDLATLWRAFGLVRRHVPGARLVVVSHPDARRAGRRLGDLAPPQAVEIVYATSYEEVRAWLARAQVLVAPRHESTGYPMKLLNYMAAGKAIVATAGGGKGLRDGETARIVRDADVEEFADAIRELLQDPSERRRLGAAAQAEAGDAQRFAQGLATLERLYDEVRRS